MNKFLFKFNVLIVSMLCSSIVVAAQLPVVSSFSILGDVAKQIGGERVEVSDLVGVDADAHAYQLTGNDIKKISAAKLVLVNGLGLESADVMRAIKQSKVAYAEASAGIHPLKNHDHDEEEHHEHHEEEHHHHGPNDPHVWNDPVLMQKYAANVAKALIRVDPEGKAYYQQRFNVFSGKLIDLDKYARQQFAAIPLAQRKILTGHDSFAYLGKRYGIHFIAPQGISTESEPSAKDIAAIIRQIKQQGLKAVFTENIKNGQIIERIAKETGLKVDNKLYSDALSKGAPAATYIDLFRYNVRVMSDAMK